MEQLKKFLEGKLRVKDWKLVVAEPVFEVLGKFDDLTERAFENAIREAAAKKFPPEIVFQGLGGIGSFMDAMGYNTLREVLLEAATKVNEG